MVGGVTDQGGIPATCDSSEAEYRLARVGLESHRACCVRLLFISLIVPPSNEAVVPQTIGKQTFDLRWQRRAQ
jgi:hypothetical protein